VAILWGGDGGKFPPSKGQGGDEGWSRDNGPGQGMGSPTQTRLIAIINYKFQYILLIQF
jgi:hypothetical protein